MTPDFKKKGISIISVFVFFFLKWIHVFSHSCKGWKHYKPGLEKIVLFSILHLLSLKYPKRNKKEEKRRLGWRYILGNHFCMSGIEDIDKIEDHSLNDEIEVLFTLQRKMDLQNEEKDKLGVVNINKSKGRQFKARERLQSVGSFWSQVQKKRKNPQWIYLHGSEF